MGFRVETAEMKEALQRYQKYSKQAQKHLQNSQSALKQVASSHALEGEVKSTIDNEISNSLTAISTGVIDCYKLLESESQALYDEFKSTTGEQSDDAILKEDVLRNAQKEIKQYHEEYHRLLTEISNEYADIADLISLEKPQDTFTDACAQAHNHLEKIINKVNQFDNANTQSATDSLAQSLTQYTKMAGEATSLGYLDENFQHFVADKTMINEINEVDQQIKAAEKEAKKQQERELQKQKEAYEKHHPVLTFIQEFSDVCGEAWSQIVHGTKSMNLPIITDRLLFVEGVVGGAGEMISDIAIGGSQLVSSTLNYAHFAYNIAMHQKTEQWRLNEIGQTNQQLIQLGRYGVGMVCLSMPATQLFEPCRTLAKDSANTTWHTAGKLWHAGTDYIGEVAHNLYTLDYEGIGKNVFDVGSLFVGGGELKALSKGERLFKSATVIEGMTRVEGATLAEKNFVRGSRFYEALERGIEHGSPRQQKICHQLRTHCANINDYVGEMKAKRIKVDELVEGAPTKVYLKQNKAVDISDFNAIGHHYRPQVVKLNNGQVAYVARKEKIGGEPLFVLDKTYLSHTYEVIDPNADKIKYQKHGDIDWLNRIEESREAKDGFGLAPEPVIQTVNIQLENKNFKAIDFDYKSGGPNASRLLVSECELKPGMSIDRYGENGTYFCPIIDGKPFSYEQRALPYAPGTKKYHQYRVIKEITPENIRKGMRKLSEDDKQTLIDAMEEHGFNIEDMTKFKIGPIQKGFNSVEGGIQIKAATTVEMYEKLGLIEEIK